MLRVRMKRLLSSRVFWGAVVLFAGIMVAGTYEDLLNARRWDLSVLYLYMVTTSVGIAHALIAIVPIIPFAFFYVEELEKKAGYYNLIRCSKRSYYLSNIAAAVLSATLVAVFAVLIFALVCLAFGAGLEPSDSERYIYGISPVFAKWLDDGRLIYVLLVNFLAFVAYASPWGLLCLLVSIFSKNKYVIIAFPFIFNIMVSYSLQGSPLDRFDPRLTLLKGQFVLGLPYGGIFYALGYHAVFITIFSVCYYVMSRRRYHHGGI